MTIYLPEVRKISMDYINMPVFNPNVFSEDEDDLPGKEELEGCCVKGSIRWRSGQLCHGPLR